MEESRKTLGIVFSRAGPTHWHATDGFSSVGRRGGEGRTGVRTNMSTQHAWRCDG